MGMFRFSFSWIGTKPRALQRDGIMAQGLERVTLQALRQFQRVGPDTDSSRSHSGMVCRSYPGSSAISATQDMSI